MKGLLSTKWMALAEMDLKTTNICAEQLGMQRMKQIIKSFEKIQSSNMAVHG
jgi:hypothetical protein